MGHTGSGVGGQGPSPMVLKRGGIPIGMPPLTCQLTYREMTELPRCSAMVPVRMTSLMW